MYKADTKLITDALTMSTETLVTIETEAVSKMYQLIDAVTLTQFDTYLEEQEFRKDIQEKLAEIYDMGIGAGKMLEFRAQLTEDLKASTLPLHKRVVNAIQNMLP